MKKQLFTVPPTKGPTDSLQRISLVNICKHFEH